MAAADELAPEYRHLLSSDERNVYRVIGHVPPALETFREYAHTVRGELALTERQCELLILTTASELQSKYEWHQHVRIGLDAGLTLEEIRAIEADNLDNFSPDETTLMRYVRVFIHGEVTQSLHEQIRSHYDETTLVGISLLIGIYMTIARLLDVFKNDIEEPFVGWDLSELPD